MSNALFSRLRQREQEQEAQRAAFRERTQELIRQRTTNEAVGSVGVVESMKPSSEVVNIARQRNMSVNFAHQNQSQILEAEKRQRTFEMLQNAPMLGEFLRDPNRAAAVQDSLDELAELERNLGVQITANQLLRAQGRLVSRDTQRRITNNNPAVEQHYAANLENDFSIVQGYAAQQAAQGERIFSGEATEDFKGTIGAFFASTLPLALKSLSETGRVGAEFAAERIEAGPDWMQDAILWQQIPIRVAQFGLKQSPIYQTDIGRQILDYELPTASEYLRTQEGIFGELEQAGEAAMEFLEPEELNFAQKVAGALGQIATQVVVSSFSPQSGAAMMASQGASQQISRMEAQDIDASSKPLAIVAGGATTYVLENLRLNSIFKAMPSELKGAAATGFFSSLRRVGVQAGQEAVQEAIENVAQNVIALVSYDADAKIFEGAAEGARVGGTAAAIFQTFVELALPRRARTNLTEQEAQQLSDARQIVSAAAATKSNKDAVEEFINNANETQTVDIDAEGFQELYQSDPEGTKAMLQALGVSEQQMVEAMSGDSITLPAAKLLTMEDEAQFDQILDITRTSEGGMTPQEARREIEEGLGSELTEKLQQITEENIEQQRDETIARDVQTQLIAAGRSKQEAKAAGKIWSSAFASLEAMGVDSKAIYEKLELRISDRTELEQAAIITDDPVITSRSQQLLDSFTDSENFISLLNKTNKRFKLNELRDIHRQLFGLDPLGKTKKQITDEIDRRRRREVDIEDRGGAKREFDRKTLFTTVTPRKTFVSEPSAQPDVTPAARSRARRRRTFEGPSVVPTAQEFLDVYEDSDAFFNLLARLEATAKVPEIRSIHRQLFNIESRYKTKKAIINQFKRQRLRELNPLYNAGQRFVLRAPYPDTDPDKILENAKSTGYEGKDAAEAADWVAGARKYGVEGMVWEMPDGSDGPRKARARELGYDVDQVMYRGAARRPILRGRAELYTTDNPAVAATYAEKPRQIMQQFYVKYGNTITIDVAGAKWDDISKNAVVTLPDGKKKKLSALYGKRKAQNSTDLIVEFFNTELNYDTIVFENIIDVADVDDVSDEALKPSKTIASMVPNALRSVNAAFDLDKAANANVLAQAVEEGYEGEDVSDANAWLRAKEKGLKLTKSARMQRAKEQGYNVNNVVYHGSPVKDIKEFRANIGDYGTGVYVTNNAGYADIYKRKDMRGKLTKGAIRDYFAGVFSGKKYKLFIRGKGIKSSEIDTVLKEAGYEIKEHLFTNPRKRTADKKIRDELMRLGYTHAIMDSTKKQKKDGIILVFEPKNLRSTDAAFDPDYADSAQILAQPIVEEAQNQGYKGTQREEAETWIRAREKGLELTDEARLERANDMGFDTSRVLYHGTDVEFDAFIPSKTGSYGGGVYLSPRTAKAQGFGSTMLETYVRGNFASRSLRNEYSDRILTSIPIEERQKLRLEDAKGFFERLQEQVNEELARDGYDGVDVGDEVLVFDPSNIRSVDAAFDPDYADTPTLLAQEDVDTSVAGGLTEKSFITTRSLAGANIVPIFADLTSSGNVYDNYNGMPITPTPYFGGPNFPYLKNYRDENMVWAFNKKGPATKLINQVRRMRDAAINEGRDPRVVVTVLAMKDDAHTSNETIINSLLRTLDAVVANGAFPKDQLQKAKDFIISKAVGKKDEGYKGLATFTGFENSKALTNWIRNASFATRKALANEMRSAKFREMEGMFAINRIVREAVDPDYRATQQGDALVAFEIDPDATDNIIDFDDPNVTAERHPAFRYGLRGKLVGSFSSHIPMEVLYKDLLRDVVARSKEGSNPKFLMERLRGTDNQIVTEEIVQIAEQIESLDDYRVAKALLAGAAGTWRSSNKDKNKGGAAPAEFEQALLENEAAVTLTKYSRKEIAAGRKDGTLTAYQLGDELVADGGLNVWMAVKRGVDYRKEYEGDVTQKLFEDGVISDDEVALVGVASNELGVRGMATFQVLKGIEEGVTILDAFKVQSQSKPDGLLPAIYATLGFQEVGEIPFDPQYYSDQEITALKAVWSRQGWTESDGFPTVAIMKWRGDDALRSEATRRFILESQEGLGIGGTPDVASIEASTESLRDRDGPSDQGDGVTREGDGRADPRSYGDRARGISSRVRGFISNILAADSEATDALRINPQDIQVLRDQYGDIDQDVTTTDETLLAQEQEDILFSQQSGTTRGTTRIMGELGSGSVLGTSPTIVKLLEAANQTTFLHESAHVFLEIYAALEQENAQVAEMMAPLREWLGWEVGQPLTVEMHEKFAGREEGFELYIKTGKAPSTALEKAFEAFRKWFNQIYQSVRGMANNLDPRAREFFDRMLATEEEIAEAQMKFHDSMTETVRDFMSPEQREKHRELQALAKKVATDKLFRKHLEQMQKSEKKEYKKEKKKISEQVRAEVSESPVFKAMSALADTESPVKLNRQATLDILGDERIVPIEPYLAEEGIDPELFAASFGYDTADQMFAEIAEDPDYDEIVEIEARRRMDDLQSDLLIDQESAQAKAIEASFNDAQVRKLKVELDAIAKKALKETIPLAAIRKRARDIIDTKPLNEIIKPAKYALQAMNLHKKAIKAAATQKWDDAFRLTQQAMLQHHMARYAFQARTEVEKGNRFLARFALHRKLDPKKIAPEFIQRIRAMMELPTASPERQAQIRQDLRMFEEQQAENNFPVALPAQVYADQDMTERRSMTLEQFREFRDSIKNLNKGGRLQSEQAKAIATKVSTEAADAIFASWGKRNLKGYSRSKKFGENIGSFLREGDAAIIRLPYLAAWLQGRKDKQPIGMVRGVIVDTLYNDLSVAINAKEKRLAALDESLLAIFKKHRISKNEIHAKVNVPEIEAGGQITKNQLFSLLLNMGTASNKQRVTDDVTLRGDAEQLLRVLEMRLDKKYFDAAQDIWNLINTQRNDLGAVHLRRTGVTPTWVEAEQLVTKYGTYAGGYYPLKYDPKADANRDLNERKQEDVFKQNSHGIAAKAQTKSGMLKERLTNVERPLYLNIDALIEHFAETATFIEMSEPIDAAWNLANSRQFGEALSQTWGSEYIEAVKTILRRSAADAVESGELGSKWLDKMLKATRINASIAILGLNLPTAALAPVSIFQTVIPRYGTKVFARGMVEFAKRGVSFAIDSANTMEKKSPFMRERTRLINREAHDVAKRKISEGVWNKAQAAGFVPMVQFEKYTVSGPLWWGVYKTSLMDGLSEQQAIAAADTAVGTTQGSGRVIDLSVMQSSTSELSKATLTFMYGYVSGYYGVVRTDVALAETNIAKTMQIVKHLMILNALASTIETLIRQGLWEDDEEDAFLLAILSRMGRNSVLVPALSNFLSRYSSTTALEDVVKKGRQSAEYGWQSYDFESGKVDGEKAQKAAIKALQALGFAKGVPGMVQADRAISVYEEDDDPTMFEYLITGPDDDN